MPPMVGSANPQCSLGKSMLEEEAPVHCILRLSSTHAVGILFVGPVIMESQEVMMIESIPYACD